MAMAMGVASLAVTAPKQHLLASPRAERAREPRPNRSGNKGTFLDWFRSALDKESLTETDTVLAKVKDDDKTSNSKENSAFKKDIVTVPLKKVGFNFFGKK